MEFAHRLSKIPPYPFAELDQKIEEKKKEGVDVISLGIGDPVEGTPDHIVQEMIQAVQDKRLHRYPSYTGMLEYRKAVAYWYENKYDIKLDPEKEIIALIGAKEGIAHLFPAFLNPGDIALAPDPGYPVYRTGPILAGADYYPLPLTKEKKFLPDYSQIPVEVAKKAKLLFINYPNMPTAAVATRRDFQETLRFAQEYDLLICHDFPYSEITFDGYVAPSFLEVDRERTLEFHSLSKTYNMTGWRIGWACGSQWAVDGLKQVKTNVDSGIFEPIQIAAIKALTDSQECVEKMRKIYRRRRDIVIQVFQELGWKAELPKGSLYIWLPTPEGFSSEDFCTFLLDKTGVVVTPGTAFGERGEGYFRISLTVEDQRLEEAMKRIKEAGIRFRNPSTIP